MQNEKVQPRDWQARALEVVTQQITHAQVATVAAAPGAGKTVFAGLVFDMLRREGVVDRMVVVVPRKTLVRQWHKSLASSLSIQLAPDLVAERSGEQGVVATYQSLNGPSVRGHALQAQRARTLYVLDEVHHLGEPDHSAWSRGVTDIVGDLESGINVAGVLNLSGTLWRTKKAERISTVRYLNSADGKHICDVDFRVDASQLIAEGQLRSVDLFKLGATVEIVDMSDQQRIVSPIADLDDEKPARAAIRELPNDDAWRELFVKTIIDRLKTRHQDFDNGPAKALIVAHSQKAARAFKETANRLMIEAGLQPVAELAVSDERDAPQILERFRKQRKPGILCTVDMAGEGYDCPEIVVIGYATNKLTPLYVRQVVARAQRVTDIEREKYGRPISAAVIIPDVPKIVDEMSAILEPITHEIQSKVPLEAPIETPDGPGLSHDPRFIVESVGDHLEGNAHVTGEADGEVGMGIVRRIEPEAERVGLPKADAPRMAIAVRNALRTQREEQPFDRPSAEDKSLEEGLSVSAATAEEARVEVLSIAEQCDLLRKEIASYERWWKYNGEGEVNFFSADVNRAGAIETGGRKNANVSQLQRSRDFARQRIGAWCHESSKPMPTFKPKR